MNRWYYLLHALIYFCYMTILCLNFVFFFVTLNVCRYESLLNTSFSRLTFEVLRGCAGRKVRAVFTRRRSVAERPGVRSGSAAAKANLGGVWRASQPVCLRVFACTCTCSWTTACALVGTASRAEMRGRRRSRSWMASEVHLGHDDFMLLKFWASQAVGQRSFC